MPAPTLSALREGYQNMWNSTVIDKNESLVESVAKKLEANKDRYKKVADQFGMPWQVIAVIHQRESSANFSSVLHNGERIIGTGRKTTLVPKGRGPFSSWEEAAIDALNLRGTSNIKVWDIPQVLHFLEGYNGWGYFFKHKNSPYMWSHTNHYKDSAGDVGDPEGGKYVADGRYDPNHYDQQIGVVALLKKLPPISTQPKHIPGINPPPAQPEPVPTPWVRDDIKEDWGPEPPRDPAPLLDLIAKIKAALGW